MKSTLRLSKLVVVLCLCLTSCQIDDGNFGNGNTTDNNNDNFSENFGNEISRDFLGSVIDKDHNPIEGVTITIGNEIASTDTNGVFIIRDATVNERFGYIKAEKAGYIHGSRSVAPSNGTNKVTIMLLEETIVGTVSSGSASTVTAPDGSEVSFDGNFVKEDGTTYSGSVNVIMHHLDPTDEDMEAQMPGMLYAENEDGAERLLQTLGMLAVELRGSGGEDLNLAEGSASEIKIPVDATLLGSAPATIPLWYFDEATGYWKEEGQATLQGNMYVGLVSHFSFWNCDIPSEAIILCINVLDENGEDADNLRVYLTSDNFGTTNGITDNNGQVCGLVPTNSALTLSIVSNGNCNIVLLSEPLGTFTVDSTLDFIIPSNPEITADTVTGSLLTCDGEPVPNGYIFLNYDGQSYTEFVENGSFEFSLYRCSNSNEFSLEGIDIDNIQTSGESIYNFTSPQTNVGDILTCENYQYSYIYYQIGNYEPVSIIGGLGPEFYSEAFFVCGLTTNPNTNNNFLTNGFGLYGTSYALTFTVKFFNFNGIGTYDSLPTNPANPDTSLPFVGLGCENLFSHVSPDYPIFHYSQNFIGTSEVLSFGEVDEFVEISFTGILDIYSDNSDIPDGEELLEEGATIQGYMRLIRKN